MIVTLNFRRNKLGGMVLALCNVFAYNSVSCTSNAIDSTKVPRLGKRRKVRSMKVNGLRLNLRSVINQCAIELNGDRVRLVNLRNGLRVFRNKTVSRIRTANWDTLLDRLNCRMLLTHNLRLKSTVRIFRRRHYGTFALNGLIAGNIKRRRRMTHTLATNVLLGDRNSTTLRIVDCKSPRTYDINGRAAVTLIMVNVMRYVHIVRNDRNRFSKYVVRFLYRLMRKILVNLSVNYRHRPPLYNQLRDSDPNVRTYVNRIGTRR